MKSSLYSSEIAEPYAQALMSLAQSDNLTESFGNDIRALVELIENSSDFQAFITNPVVREDQKKAVLRQIMGDDTNAYLLNFLMLLVDKKRLLFLEPIAQQYLTLLRQLTNTVLAEVVAAQELSGSQENEIKNKVKQLCEANEVELKVSIDPDIIGGIIIKVGSQVYDTSLRGQLRRLSLSLGGSN